MIVSIENGLPSLLKNLEDSSSCPVKELRVEGATMEATTPASENADTKDGFVTFCNARYK